MRRSVTGCVFVVAMAFGVSSTVGAAPPPSNPNYSTFTADCADDAIGSFTVTTTDQGVQVFDADGKPLVLKALDASDDATLTVGGETVQVGGSFGFAKPGDGYQDRLVECSFVESFTDTFRFGKRDVQFLSQVHPEVDWSQFVGETATVSGTASGTAWVLRPGS
jgi:hypothetical protein